MGSWISERSPAPWRLALRQATFRGAPFHVFVGTKIGGRRIALHEYPKRDTPYAEDMGKRTISFKIMAYLIEGDSKIGKDYRQARNGLMQALDKEGSGLLIHPSLDELTVVCERYELTESQEKGGWCSFEITFIEAGSQANKANSQNTQTGVSNAAGGMSSQSTGGFSGSMSRWRATTP